ncbi:MULTISPECIES: sigma-70 family RNA polymerase sigma factor [unclassified Pseudoxanthomonas]|uniref:sigma-70 family RNA polymerase sigma factor n=1 Tax=unclassified Pseudoxanthomonas TaxID=2645906 RepID=UPI00161FA9AA|nr:MULTISPECIES: sigma-70 family RNA polymerase sigma factor [unclassified Pseudoxanthomonas]MBB3276032.1 RNA polymerase sigma-70 factor (ECF subfamily) [Pseudoxanthomonas sp. OG2]MBV7472887.1 sigma-70 family RNA polymerase sigma factor [Pseudoxanthomonas sp. PXM05]
MTDLHRLAEQFQSNRTRLEAVAFRMLGSHAEAEDVVQEAWLRLNRADATEVGNLAGWLTTVVTRLALDLLRARKVRSEESMDLVPDAALPAADASAGPEHEVLLADSIGPAMLIVLDTLAPAERVAFVLHDMFAVPYEEIARMLDRSVEATRQLASRARRRVQGAGADALADRARARQVVDAFLLASRTGDLQGLLSLLAPDVVLRADVAAVEGSRDSQGDGAPVLARERHGVDAVAHAFLGRAQAGQTALVDGLPAAIWAPDGVPRALLRMAVRDGRIVAIDVIAEPARVASARVTEIGPLP